MSGFLARAATVAALIRLAALQQLLKPQVDVTLSRHSVSQPTRGERAIRLLNTTLMELVLGDYCCFNFIRTGNIRR